MTDYTKPLDDARLEAAAQIVAAGRNDPIERMRQGVMVRTSEAYATIAKARRQTGADALYEALREALEEFEGIPFGAHNKCRAALAAYERIAK